MTKQGKFITLEGVEGVGKTSNLAFVAARLRAAGVTVVETREPGGTALGEALRALLLGHKHDGMAEDAELLLMFAARAEHLARVIRPALERGDWVLCDRFTEATYAYQGGGRGVERQRIEALENWVQGDLRPDLTILLDLSVEQGLARAGQRSAPDRFEKEHAAFFHAVRNDYLRQAEARPDQFRIIDAEPTLARVQASIAVVLDDFLGSARQ